MLHTAWGKISPSSALALPAASTNWLCRAARRVRDHRFEQNSHWTSAVLQVVARELFELRADLEATSSSLESTTRKLESS